MKIKEIGKVVGIVSLVVFILCIFWGTILATPELKQLHFKLLQVFYPGFNFNTFGIIIGLIESYIYGWFIGAGFMWLCKKICK